MNLTRGRNSSAGFRWQEMSSNVVLWFSGGEYNESIKKGESHMEALFIGGTGLISTAVSKLALQRGWELTLLNRGKHVNDLPEGAEIITVDINDDEAVKKGGRGTAL